MNEKTYNLRKNKLYRIPWHIWLVAIIVGGSWWLILLVLSQISSINLIPFFGGELFSLPNAYLKTALLSIFVVASVSTLLQEKKNRKIAEKKLVLLHEWSRLMNQPETVEEVYQSTLDALEIFHFPGITAIGTVKGNLLKIQAYKGIKNPKKNKIIPFTEKNPIIRAVRQKKPIIYKEDDSLRERITLSPKSQAVLYVPIRSKGETLGVLILESKKKTIFNDRDKRLLEVLSSYISVAIKKAREREKRVSLKKLDTLRDRFLAMAAHEINTPLTVIKAKIGRLENMNYNTLTKEQKQTINSLEWSVDRLSRLVEDFRRVSNLQTNNIQLEKSTHSITSTIKKALEAYQPILKKKELQLHKNIDEQLYAKYDESRIVQVIQNLIENAIDYTEDAVWIRSWKNNNNVYISVRDDGPGIPETEQDKIFQPFYRVEQDRNRSHRQFGGTGLGLHICKRIVEAHQGSIDVTSTPGEGSTITFTFPLDQEGQNSSTLKSTTKNVAS